MLRFVSWNIHGVYRPHMASLLQAVEGDLVALQEVTVKAYRALVATKLFDWSAFSLDLRPPQPLEGKGRHLGCAIFGKAAFPLRTQWLLEEAPLPERTLIGEVDAPTQPLTICSFHAPPGVRWKERKPQSLVALARWLSCHQGPILVGMDANAPRTDHPDITQNEWWWKEEPLLLGEHPLHPLRDALRLWLATHPSDAAQISADRPRGPLAISHKRGPTKVSCRYDFIYATTHFAVMRIAYLYDEATLAGSDHALVIAELDDGDLIDQD